MTLTMKGWANYLDDETSSFENVLLTWERDSGLPSWLDGSYVKNGPARRCLAGGALKTRSTKQHLLTRFSGVN